MENELLCGCCTYLLRHLRLCQHPSLRNHAVQLLKPLESNFVRRPDCPGPCRVKGNKFGAKKIKTEDGVFDSRLEYARYKELQLLQRCGQIGQLRHYVRFILVPKSTSGREIAYEADFVYNAKDGSRVVEDTKSKPTKTAVYKLKKRLMAEIHGIQIKEVFRAR